MPDEARGLILARAILSILFNPLFFALALWWMRSEEAPDVAAAVEGLPETGPARTVLIGYGRVGRHIGALLCGKGPALTVIEDQTDRGAAAAEAGAQVIVGNAAGESGLTPAQVDTPHAPLHALS